MMKLRMRSCDKGRRQEHCKKESDLWRRYWIICGSSEICIWTIRWTNFWRLRRFSQRVQFRDRNHSGTCELVTEVKLMRMWVRSTQSTRSLASKWMSKRSWPCLTSLSRSCWRSRGLRITSKISGKIPSKWTFMRRLGIRRQRSNTKINMYKQCRRRRVREAPIHTMLIAWLSKRKTWLLDTRWKRNSETTNTRNKERSKLKEEARNSTWWILWSPIKI